MSFEPAGNFIIKAARKFGFHHQVGAGIVLEEVRRYLAENYPSQAKVWKPLKFVKKTLHIKVANSAAASSLYLYQSQIMDDFVSHDLLRVVQEIKIDK